MSLKMKVAMKIVATQIHTKIVENLAELLRISMKLMRITAHSSKISNRVGDGTLQKTRMARTAVFLKQ